MALLTGTTSKRTKTKLRRQLSAAGHAGGSPPTIQRTDDRIRYWNLPLTASHFSLTAPRFLNSKWSDLLPSVTLNEAGWKYYLATDVIQFPAAPFDVSLKHSMFSAESELKYGPPLLLNRQTVAAYLQDSMDTASGLLGHAPCFQFGDEKLYDIRVVKIFTYAWLVAHSPVAPNLNDPIITQPAD